MAGVAQVREPILAQPFGHDVGREDRRLDTLDGITLIAEIIEQGHQRSRPVVNSKHSVMATPPGRRSAAPSRRKRAGSRCRWNRHMLRPPNEGLLRVPLVQTWGPLALDVSQLEVTEGATDVDALRA